MYNFKHFSQCSEQNLNNIVDEDTVYKIIDNEGTRRSNSEDGSQLSQCGVNCEEDCGDTADVKPVVMCDMLSDVKHEILPSDWKGAENCKVIYFMHEFRITATSWYLS